MPSKRKKPHKGVLHLKKSWRTKRRRKDLDEINEDLKEETARQLINQEVDLDKPGAAQHYCIHCARYFINQRALQDHFITKVHKRRMKALEIEPYSIEESERAAGKGNFVFPQKRTIKTIETEDEIKKYTIDTKIDESYTSALHISGSKASKTFAYLSPDLEYGNRFVDINKFQKEVELRDSKINIAELQKTWDFYQNLNSNRKALEDKLEELKDSLRHINQNTSFSPEDEEKTKALFTQMHLLKEDLKTVKEAIWELEDTFIPEILSLPNEIDEETPLENSVVLKSVGEKPFVSHSRAESHLDIGKKFNLLEYQNPIQFYLCNEAVLFELKALALTSRVMKENSFLQIAGADFCRSIILEGYGMDHENSKESFILQNRDSVEEQYLVNRLHLLGGASIPALLALYTKRYIRSNDLPIRVYSSGRYYSPNLNTFEGQGLFSVCQASVTSALTIVEAKNSMEYNSEVQKLVTTASKIYDEIGCHYRIVLRCVKELKPFECKKISFEMWSVYTNQYIEVGHISACGDYISKRLSIGYQGKKERGYPGIITSTLFSVPKVLACLMEENPESFRLPEKLIQ